MEKFIKRFTVALSIICTLIFSVNGFLYYSLPSDFTSDSLKEEHLPVLGVSLKSDESNTAVVENSSDQVNKLNGQLMLGNIIPIKQVDINVNETVWVTPGGSPFGIKLFTNGVVVVNTCSVKTDKGEYSPCDNAGIISGDIITHINGEEIKTNEDLIEIVKNSKGNGLNIEYVRNNKTESTTLTPVNSNNNGDYKIGMWVRDSSAGIGTVTFYDSQSGCFAGLGHGICDVDTGELLPLGSGEIVKAEIDSISKAQSGKAGTLNGHHISTDENGFILSNSETGVYGVLNSSPTAFEPIPIGYKQEIKRGTAQIITTLDDNKPNYYDIYIDDVNYDDNNQTKNLVITITDERLLNKTNGIVQGMSGSPIIQNGKLVGAVTHVFVNNPEKGYGIFAENMLSDFEENTQNIKQKVS